MTWLKLDDHHWSDPRVVALSSAAFRLDVVAYSWCGDHLTDGVVSESTVTTLCRMHRLRGQAELVAELVGAGLWWPAPSPHGLDGNSYLIQRYLDLNPSREKVLANRAATAERVSKSRSRKIKSASRNAVTPPATAPAAAADVTPLVTALARTGRDGSGESPRNGHIDSLLETNHASSEPGSDLALVSEVPAVRTPAEQVFDAWIAATGKTSRTQLDPKRRRLIGAALKAYPLADVLDAVRGWRRDPFSRGENDRMRPFNDLELLLRDARHIEKFRDYERRDPAVEGTLPMTRMDRRALELLGGPGASFEADALRGHGTSLEAGR